MEWLNFRHLYAFWMVCQHGGFKLAADKMFIAQSAVSDHVAQLEEYLNTRLFDRNTRRVLLTPTGKQLLEYAEVIFGHSRAINQVMRQGSSSGLPSRLTIGAVGSLSRNFLFNRLNNILHQHPGMQMEVNIGSFQELSTLLRRHELDLLLSTSIPDQEALKQFAYIKVGTTPLCLAGSPKVIKKLGHAGRDLVNAYLYSYPYEGDFVRDVLQTRMGLRIQPRLVTEDISLLRFFANAGEGVALMPLAGIQNDLDRKRVAILPVVDSILLNFYAVFVRDNIQQHLVRRLLLGEDPGAETAVRSPPDSP